MHVARTRRAGARLILPSAASAAEVAKRMILMRDALLLAHQRVIVLEHVGLI